MIRETISVHQQGGTRDGTYTELLEDTPYTEILTTDNKWWEVYLLERNSYPLTFKYIGVKRNDQTGLYKST